MVRLLPSAHALLLGTWSQESVDSLHESVVHEIPSLQLTDEPFWQPVDVLHVSVPLQYRPSSQLA